MEESLKVLEASQLDDFSDVRGWATEWLKELTGQDFGDDAAAWRKWFEDEKVKRGLKWRWRRLGPRENALSYLSSWHSLQGRWAGIKIKKRLDVEAYDETDYESLQNDPNIRAISPPKESLLELREIVSNLFVVELESILCRARKNSVSEARAVLCHIAIRLIGIAGTEVGRYLSMGPSAVSRAARRGELILKSNPAMKERLNNSLNH